MNDWDVGAEFGGQDHSETTTEFEGFPPPLVGVTPSMAKTKGMDNYKQGQFADAIKWLSWAVVLIEKSGDSAEAHEVLTCRASCYKEVGEYKKAVADCSKVLLTDKHELHVLRSNISGSPHGYLSLLSNGTPQVWLIGDGLDDLELRKARKGTHLIPFSQFPPLKVRKDSIYYRTPAMKVPEALESTCILARTGYQEG